MLLQKNLLVNKTAASQRLAAPKGLGRPTVPVRKASPLQQRQRWGTIVRAEGDANKQEGEMSGEKLLKDLQQQWDSIENKPQVALYAGGGVFGVWLVATIVSAINQVPLLPKLFEFIGLGYSTWFTYRYLLFQGSREELIKDVEELKSKITGK